MYNLQKAFENSLRGFYQPAPNSPKPKHTGCRGTIHGTGNYIKTPEPTTLSKNPKTTPCRTPIPQKKHSNCSKSNSVSSECCSDTDESINGFVKTCERLHNASTKASNAKTAKMRYLESLDSAELLLITADLTKPLKKPCKSKTNGETPKNTLDRDEEKSKKHKRKEILKKVLSQDVNGRDLKNGVVVLNDLVTNGGGFAFGGKNGANETGWTKRKRQRTLRRLSNIRSVTLDELVTLSDGLRVNCVMGVNGNGFLRSWDELMMGKCDLGVRGDEVDKVFGVFSLVVFNEKFKE